LILLSIFHLAEAWHDSCYPQVMSQAACSLQPHG